MEKLKEAYNGTKYGAFDLPITIVIDKKCGDLDKLLHEQKVSEWAFITAWNPFSKTLSDEDNDSRHKELSELLKGFACYEGEGVGEDPAWRPEKSLLVLGITKTKAIEIGKRFEQNAIVFGRINEAAELICLFDFD